MTWKDELADWYKGQGEREEEARDSIELNPFDPNSRYRDPISHFRPPGGMEEYDGGDNPGGDVKVSIDALEYFVRTIDEVIGSEMLLKAKTDLDSIGMPSTPHDLRPGKFAMAELMRQKIVGVGDDDPGERGITIHGLRVIHDSLHEIKETLRKLIKEYASAEEFNKLTTQQLDEIMGSAWREIDRLGGSGTDSDG